MTKFEMDKAKKMTRIKPIMSLRMQSLQREKNCAYLDQIILKALTITIMLDIYTLGMKACCSKSMFESQLWMEMCQVILEGEA